MATARWTASVPTRSRQPSLHGGAMSTGDGPPRSFPARRSARRASVARARHAGEQYFAPGFDARNGALQEAHVRSSKHGARRLVTVMSNGHAHWACPLLISLVS